MNIFPKIYNKKEFLTQLIETKTKEETIINFNKLPESLNHKGSEYLIYINVTKYGIKNVTHNYEINYYSKELIEFLFNSKVFNRVELSINNLLCDLMNAKYIE